MNGMHAYNQAHPRICQHPQGDSSSKPAPDRPTKLFHGVLHVGQPDLSASSDRLTSE